jgi:hypothetical protein
MCVLWVGCGDSFFSLPGCWVQVNSDDEEHYDNFTQAKLSRSNSSSSSSLVDAGVSTTASRSVPMRTTNLVGYRRDSDDDYDDDDDAGAVRGLR